MKRKNSPGCKCCGCVADANHFCVCNCPTPFPKTLFIGDNNGTHSLSGGLNLSIGGVWTGTNVELPNTTVYCPAAFTQDCSTNTLTETFRYHYKLTFRCVAGGGDPAGWKLEVIFPMAGCSDGQRYGGLGCAPGTISPNFSMAAFLPFDCGSDLLVFSLPTMLVGGVAPTPGGGGDLAVVSNG